MTIRAPYLAKNNEHPTDVWIRIVPSQAARVERRCSFASTKDNRIHTTVYTYVYVQNVDDGDRDDDNNNIDDKSARSRSHFPKTIRNAFAAGERRKTNPQTVHESLSCTTRAIGIGFVIIVFASSRRGAAKRNFIKSRGRKLYYAHFVHAETCVNARSCNRSVWYYTEGGWR